MNVLRDFTHRILPWVVAAVALVIFLVTLNGWITLPSLAFVSQLQGWDAPLYSQPLYYLLTWPIRLLPSNTAIYGLNLFSAICGALTIAILARSVSLLPQDRTRDQRQREHGDFALLSTPMKWVPPILAGLALALQLTFWENATAPTGEMLDLLLFAYTIRCLLEFRVTQNETWLAKLAIVYGIGITNNWAMIGFFPLFVVALVWIKGVSFFKTRFILRMIAFGLVGLSLYLLLPIVYLFSTRSDLGFFEVLRENWRYQKNYIFILPFISAPRLRADLFMLSLTSIIPLLLIGIRWRSFRGETSAAAGMLTTAMFRLMHIALLVVCAWVFFDPKFSGRMLGYGLLPFLTFYYISALVVGYLIGYVVLVFGAEPDRKWEKSNAVFSLINKALVGVALLAAIGIPAGLIYKNWKPIRTTNGQMLRNYAERLIQNLPEAKTVLLSDDATQLSLLRAAAVKFDKKNPHLLLATAQMGDPKYRDSVLKEHGELTEHLEPFKAATLGDVEKIVFLRRLNEKLPLSYLHPSFGYFFEVFYAVPQGMLFPLKSYEPGQMLPPPLSQEVIAFNERFWSDTVSRELDLFPKSKDLPVQAAWVGSSYSRALNAWAVRLQRENRLKEAGAAFANALKFNPENPVADINLRYNAQLQAGKVEPVASPDELGRQISESGSIVGVMNVNGPFDELTMNLAMGEAFAIGNNLKQAAQYFLRVLDLTPNETRAHIGLALTYFDMQQPAKALAEVKKIRGNANLPLTEAQKIQLLRLESLCYLAQKEYSTAEAVLANARDEFPKNDAIAALTKEFYAQAAVVLINEKSYDAALKYLNTLLKMEPNHPHGLFNRALAYLHLNRLDESKRDFEKLEQVLPEKSFRVHFGLAEIAQRQNNPREALRQYNAYLETAPPDSAEYREVQRKVNQLRNTSP